VSSRTYIWVLKLIDVYNKPIVKLVSGYSADHAKAHAEKAFLCPRNKIESFGGYRTLEEAKTAASIFLPELFHFEDDEEED